VSSARAEPTRADLLHALRDCYAAPSRLNLVEQNLVREASLELDTEAPGAGIPGVPPRYIAHVLVESPAHDDESIAHLQAHIENRLAGLAWISQAQVRVRPAAFRILS
jgi:hypothetical protein